MKLIKKDRLGELLAAIAESEALYLPVDRDDGNAEYRRYEEGTELSSKLNTVRSAKDFFFPQTENLVDFKLSGNNIEVIDPRRECEDFVIFGVRACDAASFSVLDRVFIETPPEDTFYKNRREHATIVTLACSRPAATCFCHTFGIDMTEPKGGDITAWELEDGYAFRAETEKGNALLARLDSLFTDDASAEGEIAEQREQTKARAEKLPLSSLTTEKFDGRDMLTTFRDSRWASLSEACLGCGTCTFVWPTCQCYDIKEFKTSDGVKRFRCWDSCMYSDFTKMAGGQPRLTQLERFRQRFMHKLIYFPMNNDGVYGCVGCGRCLARCPIHMNIVKVMKELGKEAADNE